VTVHQTPSGSTWSYQSYVVVLGPGIDRDAVIATMKEAGIATTISTYACHQHLAFSPWCHDPLGYPNSAVFANNALTLPLIPRMTPEQVERVIETLIACLEGM
jgi:dTDP-4-amino-4,6-dideoxygalactose transaminase